MIYSILVKFEGFHSKILCNYMKCSKNLYTNFISAVIASSLTICHTQATIKQFPKVIQLNFPPTIRLIFAVSHHASQIAYVSIYSIRIWASFIFNHVFVPLHVSIVVKKNTLCGFEVSSCSTTFLIIAFHWFGHGRVDHVSDVRFVDAHAKSYGGTNNLSLSMRMPNLSLIQLKVMI